MIILTLKNIFKKNPDVRKLFGKKEIEIIIKQIEGINLTQSEKNRLSKDIRPKLNVIEEISKFKDEFKLEKNQENKRLMQKVLKTISNDKYKDKIIAILLFGSFADNTYTKRSDIDICVLFNNEISRNESTEFRIRILGEFSLKIDLQIFNFLPQKIKKNISINHKVLYKTKEFDNINFSLKYYKDEDFFIRMKKVFEAKI